MLTSATLRVYVVCGVTAASTSSVLAAGLRGLLCSRRVDGASCCFFFFFFFFLTTSQVRWGHAGVRFGGNRGEPCLVCKYSSLIFEYGVPVPYTTLSRFLQFPTALRS